MSRVLYLLAGVALAGCASSKLQPPECTYTAPGRGSYEMEQVGTRQDETITVVGILTDVDSREPLDSIGNVVARSVSSPDSVLAGSPAEAGRLAFDLSPGDVRLETNAIGYAQVRTSSITLPPGSIWIARFRLHIDCPIVEEF